MCPAPSQPSSPGWNMNTTSPRNSSRWALSSRAAPTSMAVCRSWPQACIAPSMVLLNSTPVASCTGSASMSPRSSTAGAGWPSVVLAVPLAVPVPRRTAVTDEQEVPVEISSGRPLSASRTVRCVSGRSSPISGRWCS